MKISIFEDIEAWKEARILTNTIYKLNKVGGLSKDFGLEGSTSKSISIHYGKYSGRI